MFYYVVIILYVILAILISKYWDKICMIFININYAYFCLVVEVNKYNKRRGKSSNKKWKTK
jgi:hypothetical protein